MELLLCLITVSIIAHVIENKVSLRASNMFTAAFWIGTSYLVAFALKKSIEIGDIGLVKYKELYKMTYLMALIGCGYLLPAMLGKRKKPVKKEDDL